MKKPLRIGLIMQGGRGWIGGTEYIKNIVLALGSLPLDIRSTFEICLICSQQLDSGLYTQLQYHLNNICYLQVNLDPFNFQEVDVESLPLVKRGIRKISKRISWQHNPKFNAFFRKYEIDFVYPYLNKNQKQHSYRSAAWIYDFQHKYLPEYFTSQEIEARNQSFALIAQYAVSIVLSSKTAASDFQKFFPKAAQKAKILSFRTSPSSAWYEAKPVEVQQKYCLPERFFLVSNQFWQHKNHLVIFQALRLLQTKSVYPIVICTGHVYDYRQPEYSDIILQTIHQLDIAKQVCLLGLIPRLDQIQLMRRSLAVIQPSLFEGWSTVIEDARCLGKPMILSNFPVHLEQNPSHSVFFDGHSPESLAPLLAKWWEHLSPGPDLEQEAIARTNNLSEVQIFGNSFLNIAKGESTSYH